MNFKNLLFSLFLVFVPFISNAKPLQDSVTVDATLNTYSINFDKVVPVLEQYIADNSMLVNSKTQDYDEVYYNLILSSTQYNELKQHLESWKCAIISSNEESQNITYNLENQVAALKRLEGEINIIQKKMEVAKSDSILAELTDDLFYKNEDLRKKNRKYEETLAAIGTVKLKLHLMRDETSPRQTKVRFVNMPGFEYSFLIVGNPKPGFSASYYNGYNLKYLFTRGKTFINVGIYKAKDVASADTTTLTDAFNISFGQDFYSRHFGRGSRRCFNMYSGYNVGFMAYKGETTSAKTIYVTPTIGVELFKNRFVLWDLRGGYYLPFKNNYDLRGWQISSSFNVAF